MSLRRSSRLTTKRNTTSQINNNSEEGLSSKSVWDKYLNIESCAPLCAICQERDKVGLAKKILKPIVAVLVISLLVPYVSQCVYTKQEHRAVEGKCVLNREELCALLKNFTAIEEIMGDMKSDVDTMKTYKGLTDDMKQDVAGLVKKELLLYDSDKTGQVDFALENLGGCILSTRNTKVYKAGISQISILGVPIRSFAIDPHTILQTSMTPGECWAFAGNQGTAVVQLIASIYVTHISVEHISPNLSPTGDINSAPKDFKLLGLTSLNDETPHCYGDFTYSNKSSALQTFRVLNPSTKPFKIIEFKVLSNHGNSEFTCIYRIRIHGKMAQ